MYLFLGTPPRPPMPVTEPDCGPDFGPGFGPDFRPASPRYRSRIRRLLALSGITIILAFTGSLTPASASISSVSERPTSGGSLVADDDDGPVALSPEDRLTYTTAFDALRRGDLELARASARRAQDRVLLGQVEFERLFHADHVATYEELAAWLEDYSDLHSAQRVYTLALRRRPDGAAEPRNPRGSGRTWSALVAAGGRSAEADPARAARVALNHDDLTGAYALGLQIGDWWTAGLAAWRLGDFPRALEAFERVAIDPTEDPWVRAGAGVWASRSALASGRADRVTEFLRLSSGWPATFYGQIALRQLGSDVTLEGTGPRPYLQPVSSASSTQGLDGTSARELNAFIRSDDRARRAVALMELGRRSEAENELKAGLRTAGSAAHRMWVSLANAIAPRMQRGGEDATRVDITRYATPVLEPDGGFTVEPALVYAVARKETGFSATARSSAGAFGIMQVMPATAAEITGDRDLLARPNRLLEPGLNLRLGQAYINRMLARPEFQGDILRAVASYNAGPGPMLSALRKLGPNPDPLLLIETIDVPQARDYVEKVLAAYWIYQRMFGGKLNTLDALASGASLVPILLDYSPQANLPAARVEVAPSDPSGDGR